MASKKKRRERPTAAVHVSMIDNNLLRTYVEVTSRAMLGAVDLLGFDVIEVHVELVADEGRNVANHDRMFAWLETVDPDEFDFVFAYSERRVTAAIIEGALRRMDVRAPDAPDIVEFLLGDRGEERPRDLESSSRLVRKLRDAARSRVEGSFSELPMFVDRKRHVSAGFDPRRAEGRRGST